MSGFDILGPDSLLDPRLLGDGLRIDVPLPDGSDRADQGIEGGRQVSDTSFSAHLENVFGEIKKLNTEVKENYEALARGEPGVEVHDLMTAMGKSEVAFNLMLEMRNKIVDAWQTLSRSVV